MYDDDSDYRQDDGRRTVYHDDRGRGLARDYYDDYPASRRHRAEYYYNDGRSNAGSRMTQTWEAVEDDSDDRRAVQVVKRRSHSARSHSHSHSHSHNRHREESPERPRARTRTGSRRRNSTERKLEQAAGAALVAGAIEAFRIRNEPGKWTGAKGARIATAAIGAAAIDAGIDKDPDKHSKMHIAEATIGGLIINHLANGGRDRLR
jgi:hypothetical protein